MILWQITFLALICGIQQVFVFGVGRLRKWGLIQSQLLSGLVGLVLVVVLGSVSGSGLPVMLVLYANFWAWQFFVHSVLEKSLSLRVLTFVGGDTPEVFVDQDISVELHRQFWKRAESLVSMGQAESVDDAFQRGRNFESLATRIDKLLLRTFDVHLGNLY